MKRILYFLMVLLFVIGCSKYEYQLSDPGLKVKQSVLDFNAKGGEGYILVESNTPIVAKSNSNWCQVSVKDKRIDVKVTPYDGVENRTAVVAVTTGDGFPVNVPVTQSAAKFIVGNLTFDVDFVEMTLKTVVIADRPVSVSTEETWIETWYENDSIFISLQMNNNPVVRTGTVAVTSGNFIQNITIKQAERSLLFDDLLGEWEMIFYTSVSSTTPNKRDIIFKKSTTTNFYDVTGLDFNPTVKVKFNNAERTLEIYGGQAMGTDPDNNSRTLAMLMHGVNIATPTSASVSWGTNYFYKGVWNNSFDNMVINFGDSGTWSGFTISGMHIASSTVIPLITGSYTVKYSYYKVSMTKK